MAKGRIMLDAGGDPDSFVDPASFSRILYHYSVSQQVMNGF